MPLRNIVWKTNHSHHFQDFQSKKFEGTPQEDAIRTAADPGNKH